MESIHSTTEIQPSNETEDDDDEKLKKDRRFLRFFSNIVKKVQEISETQPEEHQPRRSIIDIIRDFRHRDEDIENRDDDTQGSVSIEELENIKIHIDASFEENTRKLDDEDLESTEEDKLLLESLVLLKLRTRLENNEELGIENIVDETRQELQQYEEDVLVLAEEVSQSEQSNRETVVDSSLKDEGHPQPNKSEAILGSILTRSANTKPDTLTHEKHPHIEKPNEEEIKIPQVGHYGGGNVRPNTGGTLNGKTIHNSPETLEPQRTFSSNYEKQKLEIDKKTVNTRRPINPSSSIYREKILAPKPRVNNIESHQPNRPNQDGLPKIPDIHNDYLSDIDLMRLSEKVFIDKVSLKEIYENSDLSRADLRRLLSGESKKKKLSKDVKRALHKRGNNYDDILSRLKGNIYTDSHKKQKYREQESHRVTQPNNNSTQSTTFSKSTQSKAQTSKRNLKSEIQPRPILTIITICIFIIILVIILLSKKL